MIEEVQMILESSDLKQNVWLGEDFNQYIFKGNPTNDVVFSYLVQHEICRHFHVHSDKPILLKTPNGKYLGIKRSPLDDENDGSFRFEYKYKKKHFANPIHVLRIGFIDYFFNIGSAEGSFVFNRQKKILVKRAYTKDVEMDVRTQVLRNALYKGMLKQISKENFELELMKFSVLCDSLLKEKLDKLLKYYQPKGVVGQKLMAVFNTEHTQLFQEQLLQNYYINNR